MARREPEHFDGIEPVLAYVARKLRHATRVEQILTDAGIDYVVETDTFAVGVIFRAERVGAFFYVAPTDRERAEQILDGEGFRLKVG
ncbi:MAG: hypothetical protein IT183_08295 [Acidobacteria bacterium]|nr:hypothetical protein [Acidobacteriota bacterium]